MHLNIVFPVSAKSKSINPDLLTLHMLMLISMTKINSD